MDRQMNEKSEQSRLSTEYEAGVQNSTSLRNTLKGLQKEKSQEETQWQSFLTESRRKVSQHQLQRHQRTQETSAIATDLVNKQNCHR